MTKQNTIDLAHLEKYTMSDQSLRDEILSIFDEQALMLVTQLEEALTDDQWSNTAHTMKGASRGVGAWNLGDLCEQAEKIVGPGPDKAKQREDVLTLIKHSVSSVLAESEKIQSLGLCA